MGDGGSERDYLQVVFLVTEETNWDNVGRGGRGEEGNRDDGVVDSQKRLWGGEGDRDFPHSLILLNY